jgi:DNA-binding transcriptional LysR family regulator
MNKAAPAKSPAGAAPPQGGGMLDKLEMFIALADHRHFGRAAEACGVAQPSLSSAIKALEAELGVQLVWRGARFQGLTPEGQRVLDWARRITADARTLREEMRAARQGLSGDLRIGVIPTALTMVADLTAAFADRHPNVRVAILSRTSIEILREIDTAHLDAGITYLANEPLGRVVTVPLYREAYRLLVHAGHPLAGRAQVTWAEVGRLRLCLLTPDMQNRRIVNQMMTAEGATPAAMVESNSVIATVAHVRTGRWASVVPVKTARMFAADPALRSVAIARGGDHAVGLVAPWRSPHTPVTEALLTEARRLAEVEDA